MIPLTLCLHLDIMMCWNRCNEFRASEYLCIILRGFSQREKNVACFFGAYRMNIHVRCCSGPLGVRPDLGVSPL